ncbi:MAG: hypothetical protein AB8B95_00265 [Pseudohongiellaceae bacterium]
MEMTTKLKTLVAALTITALTQSHAQRFDTIPDLERIWDGGFSVRPVNGVDMPWNESNFPKLNDRAKAYQEVWEEIVAPKYDCQPASSPAIQYDPYHMQITQWPDRVLFRYEKDDQLRTIWLDGREPTAVDFSLQGFSVGKYEDDALIVTTTHFVFDIAGFDDYNGIPSSSQKIITEKYWLDGEQLNMTLTVEDPMFLLEPASYTTRWLPASKGYKLDVYDCDPEASRASVRFFPSKYE